MCIICDGATRQEALEDLHAKVERYGWAIQYVEGEGPDTPWAYTIGLTERYGHPELALVGFDPSPTSVVLNYLVERIAQGEKYAVGSTAALPHGLVARCGPVHPNQLKGGVFDGWLEYYGAYARPKLGWQAVEVVLPEWVSSMSRHPTGPRLDRGAVTVGPWSGRRAAGSRKTGPGRRAPGRSPRALRT